MATIDIIINAQERAAALTKNQRSILLYCESRLVDGGGLLEAPRMNAQDHADLDAFQKDGLLTWGRIPLKAIEKLIHPHGMGQSLTYWVTFTDAAWALATVLRRMRAGNSNNRKLVDAALTERNGGGASDPNLLPHPVAVNAATGAMRKATPAEVSEYNAEQQERVIIKIRPTAVAEFAMKRMGLRELKKHAAALKESVTARAPAEWAYVTATGDIHRVGVGDALKIAGRELEQRALKKSQPPAKKARKTKP